MRQATAIALFAVAAALWASMVATTDLGAAEIIVSKETTYITEPLRPDGSVDCLAAINKLSSRGVTPENNAAVLLWRALGPKTVPTEVRKQFFELLGVPEPPLDGDYLVDIYDFLDRAGVPGKPAEDSPEYWEWPTQVGDQLDRAAEKPWSKTDYPPLAAWIEANRKPLEVLIEASRRPKYYRPSVSKDGRSLSGTIEVDIHVDPSWCVRRTLPARAMLRLHSGHIDRAWQDLLACHRLARLFDQRPFLVHAAAVAGWEMGACEADMAVARHRALSAEKALAFQADLRSLPPLSTTDAKWDVGERIFMVDSINELTRELKGGVPSVVKLYSEVYEKPWQDAFARVSADPRVDWNEVLRRFNARCDKIVAAHRQSPYSERRKALLALQRKSQEDGEKAVAPAAVAKTLQQDSAPKAVAQHLVDLLAAPSKFFGGVEPLVPTERASAMSSLVQVAFGLAAYRCDHGAYPPNLAALRPKYIPALPSDPFSGRDFRYVRGPKGYKLYSIGPNGKDDGGRDSWKEEHEDSAAKVDPEADDLAVGDPY